MTIHLEWPLCGDEDGGKNAHPFVLANDYQIDVRQTSVTRAHTCRDVRGVLHAQRRRTAFGHGRVQIMLQGTFRAPGRAWGRGLVPLRRRMDPVHSGTGAVSRWDSAAVRS